MLRRRGVVVGIVLRAGRMLSCGIAVETSASSPSLLSGPIRSIFASDGFSIFGEEGFYRIGRFNYVSEVGEASFRAS